MSTLAFGALTSKREQATPETSTSTSPGIGTYVDILAGLVPAEVLAVHAFVLAQTTKTTTDASGHSTTTITDPGTLKAAFWALLAMSVFLFVTGRWLGKGAKRWDWRWDLLRVLVPPAAFFGWTLLQSSSAFDAVTDWSSTSRVVAAVVGAPFLAAVAGLLSVKADRAPVEDAQPVPRTVPVPSA